MSTKGSWLLESMKYDEILFSVIIFHLIIHIDYGSGIIKIGPSAQVCSPSATRGKCEVSLTHNAVPRRLIVVFLLSFKGCLTETAMTSDRTSKNSLGSFDASRLSRVEIKMLGSGRK